MYAAAGAASFGLARCQACRLSRMAFGEPDRGWYPEREKRGFSEKCSSRFNGKGQLTLPQALRRKLGLRAGDVLEVEQRGETLLLRPCAAGRPVVRTLPAETLRSLEGLVALGGDALEDSERLERTP